MSEVDRLGADLARVVGGDVQVAHAIEDLARALRASPLSESKQTVGPLVVRHSECLDADRRSAPIASRRPGEDVD
jgi:hypothetical protein